MRKRTGRNFKCVICGKEFYLPKCRIVQGIKCCSKRCGYKYRGQSNTGRTHFKKGQTPWNKGKPNTWYNPKGLILGRGWNKGLGMASEESRLRWTREYVEWRTSVFQRDNYTCQQCGKRGAKLNADHIKPFSLFPELRLEITNGRTLCVLCHRKTPTFGKGIYKYKYAK